MTFNIMWLSHLYPVCSARIDCFRDCAVQAFSEKRAFKIQAKIEITEMIPPRHEAGVDIFRSFQMYE